jgi:hypothetical protein
VAAFASLLLWADADGDHRCSPDEVQPLRARVEAVSLRARDVWRCDARGNCEIERGGFAWTDSSGRAHEGAVVDVHMPIHR